MSELGKEQSVMNRSQFGTGYRVNERVWRNGVNHSLVGFDLALRRFSKMRSLGC